MGLQKQIEEARDAHTYLSLKWMDASYRGAKLIAHPEGVDGETLDLFAVGDAIYPDPNTVASQAMSFSAALAALKDGRRVARAGWNGKGMWLDLQIPDDHSKMTLPYIYMRTAQGEVVPWLASQTDMLAEDWHVFSIP